MANYEVWKSRRSNERILVITNRPVNTIFYKRFTGEKVEGIAYYFCLVHKDNRIGPVLSFMSAKDLTFFYEKTHDAHVDRLMVGAVLSLSENTDSELCPTSPPVTT